MGYVTCCSLLSTGWGRLGCFGVASQWQFTCAPLWLPFLLI